MKRKITVLIFLITSFQNLIFSADWGDWKLVDEINGVKLEIQYKLNNQSCSLNKTNKYRYKASSNHSFSSVTFNWVLEVNDCNGNTIKREEEIVINTDDIGNIIESTDYTFMGTFLSFRKGVINTAQASNNQAPNIAGFKDKSLKVVTELGHYIGVMTDKSIPLDNRKKSVNSAVALFESESNTVQVSSVNSYKIKSYPIRSYFNKINILDYAKIEVSWYDITYISNLRMAPNGKYYGVITIFQKFTGYNEQGQPVYSDITKKNIEVVVEVNSNAIGKEYFTVHLGNISVVETRK